MHSISRRRIPILYFPLLSLTAVTCKCEQAGVATLSSEVGDGGGGGSGYDNSNNCDAYDENSRPTATTVMNCDDGNSDNNVWDFINYSEGNF